MQVNRMSWLSDSMKGTLCGVSYKELLYISLYHLRPSCAYIAFTLF